MRKLTLNLTVCALIFLLFAACEGTTVVIAPQAEEPITITGVSGGGGSEVPVTNSGEDSWYEIYFTNPTCPDEADRVGGLDDIIAEDLLQAELQVDVAAYDLDAGPIVDALITLAQQGVTVRIVTDTDNADLPSIGWLRQRGLTVNEDDRSALMHNKFIVIDGRYTWLGSLNYTTNGIYCNNNNLVRIDSPEIAANYITEMDEMINDGEYGPRSPVNTPNERLMIDDIFVENYFAPEIEVAPIIGELVNGAQRDIKFMAFSFTNEDIGEPMLERAEAGIMVQGVFETTGSNTEYSYYGDMNDYGLDNLAVRQDGNNRIMHHKVIIIDEETTILGSFNFTGNANDSNDENILIVHDPLFTSYFVEEFNTVWEEAKQ